MQLLAWAMVLGLGLGFGWYVGRFCADLVEHAFNKIVDKRLRGR